MARKKKEQATASNTSPEERDYTVTMLQYCNDIISGKIEACIYVQQACQRHLDDLEKSKSPDYPYYFNKDLANRRCKFSENMIHTKGKWQGTKLKLEPHQVFIQCAIWGWVKKKNDKRRFREAYIEVPRKNGKSIDAATTGLYMLVADGEKGSECYSGASTEKQALEVFRPAWLMVKKNPEFSNYFGLSLSGTEENPTRIFKADNSSRFELIVGNPGDGASPHLGIADEMHQHPTWSQYNAMKTGGGAREQFLMLVITTAGTDTSCPCYDLHLRVIKMLDGSRNDEQLFGIIYTIDSDDDWQDFRVWKKANPNYGVSIDEDFLQSVYKETLSTPSQQNANLTKHLNIWMNAGSAWMNMVKWGECFDSTLKLSDFRNQPCFVAFDLATKIDIAALKLLFEYKDGFAEFGFYYLPEETSRLAGNEHYVTWAKQGFIILTPGARTDYLYIEDELKRIDKQHGIIELAFDPHEANYLINNVSQWIGTQWIDGKEMSKCIEISQTPSHFSEPMKEMEALIYDHKYYHDNNPVGNWMMGNVVRKEGRSSGPVKYYYPTKEKNEFKIDGVVCSIMALSRAMLRRELNKSGYENAESELMVF